MAEEIRVIADLDTSLFEAGIRRIDTAVPKIREKIDDAIKTPPGKGESEGEKVGQAFSTGFIRKLVIRDAIYSVIAGIAEALKAAEANLNKLTGVDINISIWKSLGDIITGIAESINGVNNAVTQKARANIGEITADERSRLDLERYKNNPHLLKESSADLEAGLERLTAQQAADKINNQQLHINKAAAIQKANPYGMEGTLPGIVEAGILGAKPDSYFAKPGADISDDQLKTNQAEYTKHLADQKALLEIAKERDRLDATAKKKADAPFLAAVKKSEAGYAARDKRAAAKAIADQKRADKKAIADQKRADAKALADKKKADAQSARVQKNREQHANAQTIAKDEAAEKSGGKELSFDREQLEHQRATSAVRIQGGLYGRNDSAATLVQHAATQIQLLRTIAEELKQTRKNQSDLTLL